jgi:pimeloyl-ACP methyl ester carboxylesterase
VTVLAWQTAGPRADQAVVLVHSWAGDGPSDWGATGWVEALATAGHCVLVPDLPGHGESADVPLPSGKDAASWTAGLLRADLQNLGVATAAVVGYADGCLCASHLAVRCPDVVTHLVLVGCDDRTAIPGGPALAEALRDPEARLWEVAVADLVARAKRDRRHDLDTLARWAEQTTWPAAPQLGSLRTPVLLAVGAEDDSRRQRIPRLAGLLHDGRVVTVPGDRRGALGAARLHESVLDFLRETAG